MGTITLRVNDQPHSADVEPRTLLVELLREHLRLTGTHVGCDTSQCGACTVHGRRQVGQELHDARGRGRRAPSVTTIEGLAKGGELHPMQAAFQEHHGLQCGFCTPGMIMSAMRPAASGRRTRASTRCATGSRATSAAAPATTTSSRPCAPAPTACAEVQVMTTREGIGASVKRKEDRRFLLGKGQYVDDIIAAGPDLRGLRALAARARPDRKHRHGGRARPRPAWSPCSPATTSPPTGSAASRAAGWSRTRTARTWSSRRTRRSPRARSATSAIRSRW